MPLRGLFCGGKAGQHPYPSLAATALPRRGKPLEKMQLEEKTLFPTEDRLKNETAFPLDERKGCWMDLNMRAERALHLSAWRC